MTVHEQSLPEVTTSKSDVGLWLVFELGTDGTYQQRTAGGVLGLQLGDLVRKGFQSQAFRRLQTSALWSHRFRFCITEIPATSSFL